MYIIIDHKQSTFIQGRGIIDIIIAANEVIEEVKKKKSKCIIVKADFEKVYVSVTENFYNICYRGWDSVPHGLNGLGFI